MRWSIDRERLSALSGPEREEAERVLKAIEEKRKRDPLAFYYPHEKQKPFHAFTAQTKCFFGGNQSILASTPVRMANGSERAICDIHPGEAVVGVNLDGSTTPAEVVALHDHGKLPVNDWVFRQGDLTATGDHKVLVQTQLGPRIRPLAKVHSTNSIARTTGFEPTWTDNRDSEFATLFGLLIGDGSVFKTNGERRAILYNHDATIVALAEREVAGIGLRCVRRAEGQYAITAEGDGFRRSWWYDKLEEHGLNKPAHLKRIPAAAKNWSNAAVGRLLAGIFLTDGWVSREGVYATVGVQLTSKALILEIEELLRLRFGVYGAEICKREYEPATQRDAWTLKINNSASLRRFRDAVPLVGQKKAKLDEAVDGWEGRNCDSRLVRPRSAEYLGEDWTFDLTIDHPTHLFALANGVVTSNSGKTTGGLADDVIQAVDESALPDHLKPFKKFQPPFLCRIMAESFPVLETTLIEKLQQLLPVDQLLGGSWKSAYEKDLRVLHFQNGSKFFFQTYEMDVAKMGGATLDRVHFDEEPPWRAFNECRMRVMARSGDLLFTMTPVQGLTWTYDALWQNRGMQVAPDVFKGNDIEVVTVDMGDNPALSNKDIELALAGMSKEERAARKEGRFIALHGLIYADFEKEKHVVAERPLPENVNVVVGIDPGMRNAAAVVWIYLTPDDTMVAFREGYYHGLTAKQVCKEIHEVNSEMGLAPLYYVIDPAARNQEHQTGRSTQMEYADNGVVTIAGQHAVSAGINRVRERFQTDRLFISAGCTHLVDELQKYRWKNPPRTGEDGREAPVKKDDHLMDALRYAVMSRPYLPEVSENPTETEMQRLMREDRERFARPTETNLSQFGGIAA